MIRVVVIPRTHPQKPSVVVRRVDGTVVEVACYVPRAVLGTPQGAYRMLSRAVGEGAGNANRG